MQAVDAAAVVKHPARPIPRRGFHPAGAGAVAAWARTAAFETAARG